MKKLSLILLFLLIGSAAFAQDHAIFYTGGTKSYLGASYMRIGGVAGLGLSFAMTPGTFNVDHSEAYAMDEDGIKDGGEHSWRYNGEYEYDRFFLTGRLYLKVAEPDASRSSWAYIGVGPGESRHYFGYDRSQSSETEFVLDETISDGHTEWEIGYLYMQNNLVLSVGLSAIGVTRSGQLTFGIGFAY